MHGRVGPCDVICCAHEQAQPEMLNTTIPRDVAARVKAALGRARRRRDADRLKKEMAANDELLSRTLKGLDDLSHGRYESVERK
jgi:hypothetical protein